MLCDSEPACHKQLDSYVMLSLRFGMELNKYIA